MTKRRIIATQSNMVLKTLRSFQRKFPVLKSAAILQELENPNDFQKVKSTQPFTTPLWRAPPIPMAHLRVFYIAQLIAHA